jgi:MFS family permease
VVLVLTLLALILLYVGSFLFIGETVFGSMGWGILHGLLLTVCLIVPIGLNLAGGWWGDWVRGLAASLVVGIAVGVILSTNVLHNSAVWLAQQLQTSIAIDFNWLVWLAPAIIIGLVLGLVALVVGLRSGGAIAGIGLFLVAFLLGFLVVGFFAAVPFSTQVAAALAVTLWLILWIALSAVFATRRGLDPKKRYDKLVPRESKAQFAATRAYLEQQWQRQRKKLVGR